MLKVGNFEKNVLIIVENVVSYCSNKPVTVFLVTALNYSVTSASAAS